MYILAYHIHSKQKSRLCKGPGVLLPVLKFTRPPLVGYFDCGSPVTVTAMPSVPVRDRNGRRPFKHKGLKKKSLECQKLLSVKEKLTKISNTHARAHILSPLFVQAFYLRCKGRMKNVKIDRFRLFLERSMASVAGDNKVVLVIFLE